MVWWCIRVHVKLRVSVDWWCSGVHVRLSVVVVVLPCWGQCGFVAQWSTCQTLGTGGVTILGGQCGFVV